MITELIITGFKSIYNESEVINLQPSEYQHPTDVIFIDCKNSNGDIKLLNLISIWLRYNIVPDAFCTFAKINDKIYKGCPTYASNKSNISYSDALSFYDSVQNTMYIDKNGKRIRITACNNDISSNYHISKDYSENFKECLHVISLAIKKMKGYILNKINNHKSERFIDNLKHIGYDLRFNDNGEGCIYYNVNQCFIEEDFNMQGIGSGHLALIHWFALDFIKPDDGILLFNGIGEHLDNDNLELIIPRVKYKQIIGITYRQFKHIKPRIIL